MQSVLSCFSQIFKCSQGGTLDFLVNLYIRNGLRPDNQVLVVLVHNRVYLELDVELNAILVQFLAAFFNF